MGALAGGPASAHECRSTLHSSLGSPPSADAPGASRGQAADRVRVVELPEAGGVVGNIERAVAQHVIGGGCHHHHTALHLVGALPARAHLLALEEDLGEGAGDVFGRDSVVEVTLGVGDLLLAELLVGLSVHVLDDTEDGGGGEGDHDDEADDHLPRGVPVVAHLEVLGPLGGRLGRATVGGARRVGALAGPVDAGRRHGVLP